MRTLVVTTGLRQTKAQTKACGYGSPRARGRPPRWWWDRRLRGCGRHDLREKLLALGLRALALHGRRETLEDAVLEGGDDGVVDIALAADRRRVGELVGGGADRVQHL